MADLCTLVRPFRQIIRAACAVKFRCKRQHGPRGRRRNSAGLNHRSAMRETTGERISPSLPML